MQVRINLLTKKHDYLWEYTIGFFGGILPSVGDEIELSFDNNGAPTERQSLLLVSCSFKVIRRSVEPGKIWWIDVEGDVPDF